MLEKTTTNTQNEWNGTLIASAVILGFGIFQSHLRFVSFDGILVIISVEYL